MVQALANNINIQNLDTAKTLTKESESGNFQDLFSKKTSSLTESTETANKNNIKDIENFVSNKETITTKAENKNEETDSLVSEIEAEKVLTGILQELDQPKLEEETEQVLSGILQTFVQPQIEDTKFEQPNIEQSSEDNLLSFSTLEPQTDSIELEAPAIDIKPKETAKTEESKSIEELVDEDILQELNIESIEAEASSQDSSSDLMQNQTPQEHGVKAMIQTEFEFKEVKATEVQTTQESVPAQETNPNKVIEQITKHMDGLKTGSRVNMVLNPESLGKVSIQIINTKEGLSAQFTVATQEARNIIMKGLDGLKDTLLSHGVNIDNVSVKLSDTQESKYNPDWTEQENSNGGNKQQGSKKEEKNKENFEQTMNSFANENGEV